MGGKLVSFDPIEEREFVAQISRRSRGGKCTCKPLPNGRARGRGRGCGHDPPCPRYHLSGGPGGESGPRTSVPIDVADGAVELAEQVGVHWHEAARAVAMTLRRRPELRAIVLAEIGVLLSSEAAEQPNLDDLQQAILESAP